MPPIVDGITAISLSCTIAFLKYLSVHFQPLPDSSRHFVIENNGRPEGEVIGNRSDLTQADRVCIKLVNTELLGGWPGPTSKHVEGALNHGHAMLVQGRHVCRGHRVGGPRVQGQGVGRHTSGVSLTTKHHHISEIDGIRPWLSRSVFKVGMGISKLATDLD